MHSYQPSTKKKIGYTVCMHYTSGVWVVSNAYAIYNTFDTLIQSENTKQTSKQSSPSLEYTQI